jgi:Ataxin-3
MDANHSAPNHNPGQLLYFEKQQAALCGVHALNTLLQGPYFNEIDLAEIAQHLDAMETALLGTAAGENVDASGMFSTQVLAKALEVWGLGAVPLGSPAAAAARASPQDQEAFLCNLHEHWFTCRRLGDEFWNFNSLFASPEPLSPFYLAAFLSSLQDEGYTVYWIQGKLPQPDPGAGSGASGSWIPAEDARSAAQETQRLKHAGYRQAAARGLGLGNVQVSMSDAVRYFLRPRGGSGPATSNADAARWDEGRTHEEDEDLQRALAASRHTASPEHASYYDNLEGERKDGEEEEEEEEEEDEEDDDDELRAAIAASLEDHKGATSSLPIDCKAPTALRETNEAPVPEELVSCDVSLPPLEDEPEPGGGGNMELALRLPDGTRTSRWFRRTAAVAQLAAWVAKSNVRMDRHRLVTAFPRKELNDWSASLVDAGLEDKQVLLVEVLI